MILNIVDTPHTVYILQSTHPNHLKRTYVGYTVNLSRRLRQHNGELVGGAKYTKIGRPYRVVAYIEGFPSKTNALQFEWRNHHPSGIPKRKHRPRKNDPPSRGGRGGPRQRGGRGFKGGRGCSGMDRRVNILEYVLHLPRWTKSSSTNKWFILRIHWLVPNYSLMTCPYPYIEVFDDQRHIG